MQSKPPARTIPQHGGVFDALRRLGPKAAVAAAVGLACFWIVDLIAGYVITNPSPIERSFPSGDARVPRPYVMFGGAPNRVDFNELGYRGPAPAKSKPASEFRIFMLGGSTVLNGKPPIARLLEERLAKRQEKDYRVYNFGVVSSCSGMELARIVHEISDLEPDLILAYNGGNDLAQPQRFDPRPGYPFNFLVYENNPVLQRDGVPYPSTALWAYGSPLLRHTLRDYFTEKFSRLDRLRLQVGWQTDPWRVRIAETYIRNLEKSDRVARAFGADFVVFFQPMLYFKEPLAPPEQAMVRDKHRLHAVATRGHIRNQAAGAKIRWIDLSDTYDGQPQQVFIDGIHTNQAAKPHIADALAEALVAERLLGP